MDRDEERRWERLGPFELKNRLVELARHRSERTMLNAGRGNPNWIALEPRAAFALLHAFALEESRQAALPVGALPDASLPEAVLPEAVPRKAAYSEAALSGAGFRLGGLPRKLGSAQRLKAFLDAREPSASGELLLRGIALGENTFGIDPDLLVAEWVDGVLGHHYPVPPRMLCHAEALVRAHLCEEVFGADRRAGDFDLFAVEGASAGIAYVFQTLVQSGLLARGDRIALGVPIFTPYLEIPRLSEYGFDVVEVAQDEADGWRYPASEIDRLRDPRVKAFLAVNPSNPTAVAMEPETVERIARIVAERPDLIVITDDVYAPFVDGHWSLAAAVPRNTILLYSFSKFWGATGLRLGVVGLHASNAFDRSLAAASRNAPGNASGSAWGSASGSASRSASGGASSSASGNAPGMTPGVPSVSASARYGSLTTDPDHLKLIDRMVADSRAVGMNHTAGLSTPQQVQMALFALDALLDTEGRRKRATRALLRHRFEALYRGAGLACPQDPRQTHYYTTFDIPALAARRYGDRFAHWLVERFEPIDFIVRLAEERGIVLLDGSGFDAPRMSVRVSLANLPNEACEAVGRGIAGLLAEYQEAWAASISA